eukprot:scaffold20662_cov101-Isochrysis_galbana.AAC.4
MHMLVNVCALWRVAPAWHARPGCAVRALERDTRPCHRGPNIFTRPGRRNIFRDVPLWYTGGRQKEGVVAACCACCLAAGGWRLALSLTIRSRTRHPTGPVGASLSMIPSDERTRGTAATKDDEQAHLPLLHGTSAPCGMPNPPSAHRRDVEAGLNRPVPALPAARAAPVSAWHSAVR